METVTSFTPNVLAFVGDAAHTLDVRVRITSCHNAGTGSLHVMTSKFVNAATQARVFDELCAQEVFTPEESDIARRAKNAHTRLRAKSATGEQYHKATAFEAIIGFLELTGNRDRQKQILDLYARIAGIDCVEQ